MENSSEKKEQQHLLSVRDIVVRYVTKDETVNAVNHVSFDLDEKETLGMVGETGAGKTSIAKTILRILPVPPAVVESGEVYLEGQDLLKLPDKEMEHIRGKRISMIFQDPMTALNPVKRIGRQVAEGIHIHEKLPWKEAEARAMEILEMVGISEDRFREYPHQFSGGMRQRAVIAIALACNPDILIADEPTSALDVTIQAEVLDLIHQLQQDRQMAMILITHDFGVVAENCDKVAVIYAGEFIEYGTTEQIFENPTHPYTQGLFGAIPTLETEDVRLHSIHGAPPDPTALPAGCKFRPRCPYATELCQKEIPVYDHDGHQCKCIRAADDVAAS